MGLDGSSTKSHAMMDPDSFDERTAEIARLNDLDEDTAGWVVAVIGDCIAPDDKGRMTVTIPDGRTLSVKLPMGEDEEDED